MGKIVGEGPAEKTALVHHDEELHHDDDAECMMC